MVYSENVDNERGNHEMLEMRKRNGSRKRRRGE